MATLYYFKNLPQVGDKVKSSKVSTHRWREGGYDVDYWIEFENFGWVHLPIGDDKLEQKLKESNVESGEYSYDEFIKLVGI